jgi:pimeloyl-ACP methyl ester carboxylesterase
MKQIELSAGLVDYEDTGGDGPAIVFLHGLLMDGSLWAGPISELAAHHRCVAPTLPLGAHRHAMRADADLSLAGMARLVTEFLDRLDLHDVTLVGNDTGGAILQLIIGGGAAGEGAAGGGWAERTARVVLVSCEAFGNYPARLTGQTLTLAGKLSPRMFWLFMQQLRLRPLRRLPIAFSWLTKRGDAATARWVKQVRQPRDVIATLRSAKTDAQRLREATEHLPDCDRPVLVVWASSDRVMPPEHGRRLAGLFPRGSLVEVADSYTLIPLDQPAALATAVREFTKVV